MHLLKSKKDLGVSDQVALRLRLNSKVLSKLTHLAYHSKHLNINFKFNNSKNAYKVYFHFSY